MTSALPTPQSLDNALQDAATTARQTHPLREKPSTVVNVKVNPSIVTMNDKRKKRKTASSNQATSSSPAAQMSIQDAARKLHDRILQVAQRTTTPKSATSTTPPLSSLLSTRQTVTSLPSSTVMSSANTSGEESSSLSSDSALSTASSVREREPLASVKNTTVTSKPSHREPADKHTGHQPSLYEAVFGPQIALELHHAAAASQPKTPPAQHASQGFFQLPATPVTPSPRTPRSLGMSARLHRLSCTPQLGSPERARRGGPPVGVDPHNSPTLQHLQREDEMAFSHPHQSYVLLSPSRKTRKTTSSPAMSSAKRQRLLQGHDQEADDSVIGMLASMAEERTKSRTSTPSRTSAQHSNGAFADPRSITPVKARVMSSSIPHNASAGPVTPPPRSVALPEGENSNEADLLLNFANSPTVKQQPSARQGTGFGGHHFDPATPTRHGPTAGGQSTPSLLDSIERRKSRHRFLSANGTPPSTGNRVHHQRTSTRDQLPIARTLFEEEHVLADRGDRSADSQGLALGPRAFSTPGKKAESLLPPAGARAGSSPITPPYSDRVKQNAIMPDIDPPSSAKIAKSKSAPASAVPPFDTPPATPARQQIDKPSNAALARRASALGIPQTPEDIAAAWDASSEEEDADEEADRRTKERFIASKATTPGLPATPGQRHPRSRVPTAKTEMERNGSSDTPRTPSPAPTISSEPRTPHTPNTSAFVYSEYINVSPSPNPRSRVMSAKGRFPSCNGHLVPLEDAMTWGEASARASGRNPNHLHSTPTRQRQYSTEGTMLTPGPILYATSPTFNVRGESSKRARMESQQYSARHQSTFPTTESRRSVALPLDAGFKEDFGQVRARTMATASLPLRREESNDSMDVDEASDAATPSTTSHNVGLGLSYE